MFFCVHLFSVDMIRKLYLLKNYLVGLHLFFSFKPQLLVLPHRLILWPFGPYL